MSITRFRLSLAILAFLALGFVAVAWVIPTVFAERDGWDLFSPVPDEMEEIDPLIIEPGNLITFRDQASIRRVVEEARNYGIPWSVAVVSDATLAPGVPLEEQAQTLFEDADIESRPGADDGLLMFVVVPEADHTATSVHFVTGENFYPRGGITPDRLQWIADVQMAPFIADNAIGDAVIEGAIWVEWTQLFEPTPDPAPTVLQEGLQRILRPLGTVALAGLMALVGGTAIAVAVLTRRGTGAASSLELDPIRAAALANGRVNRRVIAGAVIDAIDRGVLVDSPDGLSYVRDRHAEEDNLIEPKLTKAVDALVGQDIMVTPASLARHLRTTDLPRVMEDQLANADYLCPRSYRFELALRILAATGTLAGILGLVLSVFGEVESTLAIAIPLTALSIAVLIWNEFRGWTTRAGRASLDQWLLHHGNREDRERHTFDTIRWLDEVPVSLSESAVIGPNRRNLLESLRHQG